MDFGFAIFIWSVLYKFLLDDLQVFNQKFLKLNLFIFNQPQIRFANLELQLKCINTLVCTSKAYIQCSTIESFSTESVDRKIQKNSGMQDARNGQAVVQ